MRRTSRATIGIFHVSSQCPPIPSFPSCRRQPDADPTPPGICKASQGNLLPNTVQCARKQCDSGDLDVGVVLSPLELACNVVGHSIPASVISNAVACATSATAAAKPTTTTTTAEAKTAAAAAKTTQYITKLYSTTVTQTTTDHAGKTVVIVIPIIVGPSTTSFGVSSTLSPAAHAASSTSLDVAVSSVLVTPSPAATSDSDSAAAATSTTLSTTNKATSTKGSSSNGSLFSNPQAGAGALDRPWALALSALFLLLL